MQKLIIFFIIAVIFLACPAEPPLMEIIDPAFWFEDIYNELITREQSGAAGLTASYEYVCEAINIKWGAGTVTPAPGTETQPANCEYLLKMFDQLNSKSGIFTNYSESKFAVLHAVDIIAVNEAVSRFNIPVISGKRFLAVGAFRIAYSDDTAAWTQITTGIELSSITYGNDIFVAASSGGRIAYSTDGFNWASAIVGSANDNWNSVTYGNGRFLAVGSGNNNGFSTGRVSYSADGKNWITLTYGPIWLGVTYCNNRFTAAGTNGVIAFSTNGINWTNISAGSNSWHSITHGNGIYVAAGSNGIKAHSANGANWEISQGPMANDNWNSITYANNAFVSVGTNGTIAHSTDGIYWLIIPTQNTTNWKAITFSNDMFTAAGSEAIAHSSDGIKWTITNTDGINWNGICYGGN